MNVSTSVAKSRTFAAKYVIWFSENEEGGVKGLLELFRFGVGIRPLCWLDLAHDICTLFDWVDTMMKSFCGWVDLSDFKLG